MDKTLEIIMVAMTLIVAAVVVISMLQSESGEFGDFSDDRRNSTSCNFEELEYERALDKKSSPCTETSAATEIKSSSTCDWASSATATDYC